MGVDVLHADARRQAFRTRVLEQLVRQFRVGARLVLVEAQAGQGKTTAATQFFTHLGVPPVWYSLSLPDRDPVFFLAGLYGALTRSVPEFRLPVLEEMLEEGAVSPAEYPRVVAMLLAGLTESANHGLYLVFDDIHHLDAGGPSTDILRCVVTSAPDEFKLLMLSRQPVLPALGVSPESLSVGIVNNADLAFTAAEIGELYTGALGIPIATADVRRLSQLTEGWAMGLVLLASGLETGRGLEAIPEAPLDLLRGRQIPDYFRAQLMDRLDDSERNGLYRLAMLDRIPAELAAELTPELDLDVLAQRNLFLRRMAGGEARYAFHHLFHESLRRLAERELTLDQRRQVLQQAAYWHRDRREGEAALGYLLRAEDYPGANALARDAGLDLLARNRIVILHELLHDLPGEVLQAFPWLGYLLGLSLLSKDPPKTHDYLDEARGRFRDHDDGPGELLATSQLMYFHIAVDARYQHLEPLLDRADTLFEQHAGALSVPMRVECAQYISYALTHTDRDKVKAAEYSSLALRLAEQHRLDNAMAMIICNQGYEGAFRGDWSHFARCMDRGYPLQDNPRVTAFSKFLLHFAQANLLLVSGDFFNYRHKTKVIEQVLSDTLFDRTVCKPFLYVYEIDMAIAEGRTGDAGRLVDEALGGGHAAANAHFRSQYLHYGACVAAIRGDQDTVERDACESLRLREAVGHPFHIHVNHLIIGGAYARISRRAQALHHLNAVLTYAKDQKEESLAPGACFYIAWLELLDGRREPALAALRQGLERMRRNRYLTFFSWEPRVMQRLLVLAVAEGIEAAYARHLAAERLGLAILDDGRAIPLLDVRTLSGISLALDETVVVGSELTPGQRELLAMLAAAPEAMLSYEEIQLALWPDGSPDKIRARLDTLIARLRRVITRTLPGTQGAHYLVTEQKHLRLANCRIDLQNFALQARLGLAHAEHKRYWQASNAFRLAHHYWQGPIRAGGELLNRNAEQLKALYRESVIRRVEILCKGGERREALNAAEIAVNNDPTDEKFVALLYELHARAGDTVKARKAVRDYEAALRNEEYSEEEIADMRERFWAGTD